MRDSSALPKAFEALKYRTDVQKRGYDFQAFVGRIFQTQHFRVERKARASKPRQVDLFATRGDEIYLIETKWRKDKANIGDIDSLFTRLDAAPTTVIGILVSYQGFTNEVLKRVSEKSHHPVLLLSGAELENALGWSGDFIGLLRRKKEALLVHREVLLDRAPDRRSKSPQGKAGELPASATDILFPDGSRTKWLTSGGEFGKFAFVPEMPDIDWVSSGGLGVTFDVVVPVWDQNELLGLLFQLTEQGWVSEHGSWSIQQSTTNWHGFGARSLSEAIRTWAERYKGLDTHETEELCYFDSFDDGWYTLTAALSADKRRIVRRAEFSFQLVGIPFDPRPLQELCERVGVREFLHFRPRNDKSVIRERPRRTGKRTSITPSAFVVETSESDIPGDEEWVVGIVVENPFIVEGRRSGTKFPTWLPDMLRESQYIICRLRSWHRVDSMKSSYELWEIESAWSSDALIVRPLADWPYEPGEELPSLVSGDLVLGVEDGTTIVTPDALNALPVTGSQPSDFNSEIR